MKLLHLLALFFSLQPSSAVTEYYVWFNTLAACPTESCLTFNEYVNDTETYFTSNTSFIFLEGEHYLDSALVVDGKSDITMKASTNASVTITLSSNAVIRFQDSQAFVVSLLKIHYHGSDRYKSALELVHSQNMQLTNITFKKILDVRPSRAVLVYNSTARISDCSFFNGSIQMENPFAGNDLGGAILITLSTVEFLGCTNFIGNTAAVGGAITAVDSALSLSGNVSFASNSAVYGGAIYIVPLCIQLQSNIAFEGSDTVAQFGSNLSFTNNSAESGGAMAIEQSDVQLLGNTAFENNSALTGGAIYVFQGGRLTVSGNATFTGNMATCGGGLALEIGAQVFHQNISEVIFLRNIAEFGGAVYIALSDLQLQGNTTFKNNSATISGGAIHATSGGISLAGNTTFTCNTASQGRGGGVALEGSARLHFLLRDPLQVIFLRNEAKIGGAIFVDDSISQCSGSRTACFFDVDGIMTSNLHLNISLNSASQSGPVIYGGNLENCQVDTLRGYGFYFLQIALNHTTPISPANVSSDPLKIYICENETMTNCTTDSVKVKRGELFNISLITVGQLNTSVSAGIIANSDSDVQLDPQFPTSNGTCTNVGITLLADEHVSNHTVYLFPDGPCGNMPGARIAVEITLEECPPGFDISRDHCDCEKRLFSLINEGNITCDINNEVISLRGNAWIQPIWNNSNYLGFIWHPNCPLGYCKSSQEPIHLDFSIPNTSDSLCSENRHGLLCGACRQNYSLSLHDLSCNLCEDKYLSLLLFFAFAGIALIAFLLVLHITVADGTINGLILYANIVSVNRDIFFPPGVANMYTYPLTVFLAWLNLDFGIATCFYDGLDAYSYAWLQYLFPLYLWFLIGVIIFINKLPIKIGGLFGSNPVAVLATVVLMSYTKLLQSSIVALAYTQLDYPDNNTNVWLYDANITYFEGKHIALAVVAILVIAMLILPYTLLLTFGYRLLACSNRRCCFWLNTLKPFLDPYYAPFNGNTRNWNGFLLMVRGGLYVGFAINALRNPSANLVAISVIFLISSTWLGYCIYEKLYVNILEASFILNVCILSIATFHVRAVNGNQAVVTYLSLGTAFAEFIGIVIFHLYSIIRDKLPCKKKPVEQKDPHAIERHRHRAPALEQQQKQPSDAKFRDSILDDIEMDTY